MTIDWLAGDDAIVLSAEEARAFEVFRKAEHTDYVSLVREAGYDPARFFEHGNWQDMDLRDSDVTGVSFRSADLTGVCLYRDQYNAVRQTKPRSLDKARVQESREGGKGTSFTIEFDIARDQFQARADFLAVWKDQVSRKKDGEIEKIDWALVNSYLRRLEGPFGRIWALDEILESIGSQVPNSVYDACTARFKLSQVLRVVGWSTAVELLQVATLRDDERRIEFLEERSKDRAYLDVRVTAKAVEKAEDLALLSRVMALYESKGWQMPPFVQMAAASKLVKTIDGVREFLDLMTKAGVRPDTAVFSTLAQRAETMDGVREYLDLMTKAGVRPDTAVFSTLAQRAETMDGVREFLDLMTKAGVRPDTAVFSNLAQRAETMDGVREFLDLMTKAGVRPDTAVFSNLAQRAETMDGVRQFLDLMTKAGVRPDTAVFSTLAQRAETMDGVREYLDLMTKAGVRPDTAVFSTLAQRAETMDGVREFLDLMTKAGVRPDTAVFSKLAESTKTMDGVREFLDLMTKAGVRPDTAVFSKLAESTKTMDGVREFLDLMTKAGVRPDTAVFSTLAQRAKTMDGVREFLDLMTKAGVRPDFRHWTLFIGAGRTVDDVQEFLQELKALGRKPSITHLNQLMRNTSDHLEAERVWSLVFSLGLKADFITWGTLISKMPTWASAWDVYRSRRPAKAAITGAALGPLLRKAATRQDVRVTLQEYSRRKVALEPNSVSAVMRAPLADHDVVWALHKMTEMGLDVQAIDSTAWTEGADRFEEIRKRL
jgi:DNA-binding LacI/PurR family transcriptional regulator